MRQHHRPHRSSSSRSCGGIIAIICGIRESSRSRSGSRAWNVIGHGVDAVERVEDRPERPADRDVVAVRLPVEVIAQRSEEVVEIGYVIAQFGDVDGHVVGSCPPCCASSRSSAPSTRSSGSSCRWSSASRRPAPACRPSVFCMYERFIVLEGAAHADLSRNRAELQRLTLRTRDRLHPSDAGHLGHGLGDPLDHQEVRRVAKVVIGFDEQQFGVHPGDGEMSFSRCESLVRRQVGGQVLAVVVARLVARQGE